MKELLALVTITVVSFLLNSFSNVPTAGEGLAVIVNKVNPVSSLSAPEAKVYFLREVGSHWPGNNKTIKPVTRKDECAERDAFYSQVMKMSDMQVEGYFAERQFQNNEHPPAKVNGDAEVVEFVQQEVGGIGFISAKSLTPDIRAKVKVVLEF